MRSQWHIMSNLIARGGGGGGGDSTHKVLGMCRRQVKYGGGGGAWN